MITLKINKKKVKVPSCWEEVTTKQYIELVMSTDHEDYIAPFAILVGMDINKIKQTKSYDLENTIFSVIDFLGQGVEAWKEKELPKFIRVNEKLIEIPTKLGLLTLAQSIALRTRIDSVEYLDEAIAYACAIYLQPLYDDGPFDRDKAAKLEEHILKMPIVDTYPVGFFFLEKYLDYGNPLTRAFNLIKTMFAKIVSLFGTWLRGIGWMGSRT